MHIDRTIPPGADRVGALLTIASALDAAEIGAAIDALIDRLDASERDPDEEADGDELDGNGSEDDFMFHGGSGPGCPLTDPGGFDREDEDVEEDGRHIRREHRDRLRRDRCETIRKGGGFNAWHEYRLIDDRKSVRFGMASDLLS